MKTGHFCAIFHHVHTPGPKVIPLSDGARTAVKNGCVGSTDGKFAPAMTGVEQGNQCANEGTPSVL